MAISGNYKNIWSLVNSGTNNTDTATITTENGYYYVFVWTSGTNINNKIDSSFVKYNDVLLEPNYQLSSNDEHAHIRFYKVQTNKNDVLFINTTSYNNDWDTHSYMYFYSQFSTEYTFVESQVLDYHTNLIKDISFQKNKYYLLWCITGGSGNVNTFTLTPLLDVNSAGRISKTYYFSGSGEDYTLNIGKNSDTNTFAGYILLEIKNYNNIILEDNPLQTTLENDLSLVANFKKNLTKKYLIGA